MGGGWGELGFHSVKFYVLSLRYRMWGGVYNHFYKKKNMEVYL